MFQSAATALCDFLQLFSKSINEFIFAKIGYWFLFFVDLSFCPISDRFHQVLRKKINLATGIDSSRYFTEVDFLSSLLLLFVSCGLFAVSRFSRSFWAISAV